MPISFACPSCAAVGSVDASAVGRQARCKHCGHLFKIPDPAEPEPAGYSLEEPVEAGNGLESLNPTQPMAFVRSRGAESSKASRKPRPKEPAPRPRTPRRSASRFQWRKWLLRGGIATTIILAATTFLVPSGMLISAGALLAIGMVFVLVGFGAGAYGAFQEDFLYGFLYLVIPLYSAYYIVTRWEDLWIWLACSTVGVGLILLGTEMLRWAGVAV